MAKSTAQIFDRFEARKSSLWPVVLMCAAAILLTCAMIFLVSQTHDEAPVDNQPNNLPEDKGIST
jgi:hypothetical protein